MMLHNLYQTLNQPLQPLSTDISPELETLNGIKAVIFDIYGTLVLSGTGDISIAQSINKEAELRTLLNLHVSDPIATERNLSELFYGLIQKSHSDTKEDGAKYPEVDIREIWDEFFGQLGITVDPLKRDEIAVRFECAVNPVWPIPCLNETLGGIRARSYKTGIVSNAQFYTPIMLEAFTDRTLAALGFDENLCVWSYRERLGKPSVELFQKLEEELAAFSIAPGEALYVGNDMLNDIWTASQIGMRTALYAGDQRSLRLREDDPRSLNLEPDVVLTELRQLLRIL